MRPESTLSPMQPGRSRPFISQEAVLNALERLLYVATQRAAPESLYSLRMIDEFLATAQLPQAEQPREYSLQHLLIEMICERYFDICAVLGLRNRERQADLDSVKALIEEESQQENPELIGWSWLYYLYVRVDLNISPEGYSDLAHVDTRTLRRYKAHGIRRLTEHLIQKEWEAQQRHRKRQLFTQLPGDSGGVLLEREEPANTILRRIETQTTFLITGEPGVGKTAFTRRIVEHLIETEQIERLVWMDDPPSAALALSMIQQELVPSETALTLKEMLLLFRSCIVVDRADALLQNAAAAENLIKQIKPSLLFFVSSEYYPQFASFHVVLRPLSESVALRLVRERFSPDDEAFDLEEKALHIVQQIGGNPLSILREVDMDMFPLAAHSLSQVIDAFSMEERKVLYLTSLAAVEGEVFSKFCPHLNNALTSLLYRHLIIKTPSNTYKASPLLQQSVQAQRTDFALVCDSLLSDLAPAMQSPDQGTLSLLELLLTDSAALDREAIRYWIRLHRKAALQQGNLLIWQNTFLRLAEIDPIPEWFLAVGVLCRSISEWDTAETSLRKAVLSAGERGEFLLQIEALIDLAALLRRRGQYAQAETVLLTVQNLLKTYHQAEIERYFRLEMAQILIEKDETASAEDLLRDLPEDSHALTLLAEIALRNSNPQRAAAIAVHSSMLTKDDSLRASLQTIIARAYEQQGAYDAALEHFSAALMLLNRGFDAYRIARAQMNTAAALIHLKQFQEAEILLNQARVTLTRLNDRVGLTAVQHNLNLIDRLLATGEM